MGPSSRPGWRWWGALALATSCAQLHAQLSPPTVEVASVRAILDDTRSWAVREMNAGRYRSQSNVNQLITGAWKLKNYQISGAPAWIFQERFEVQGTTGRVATVDEERLMVQAVLADRFGLRVHRESREIPVYVLVVGKNGPKMETAKRGWSRADAASILNRE